ncbi:hypothetical protein KBP53_10585 [Corynebacterium genitalium ATCC 33030]|uniref:Uncharacterized protein n=1 Tax=Corynebacterium genitalium ATCC 33030 TaxID=585529 RepID=D7W9H6_9CORY|nr:MULTISPECIES: hypothetical protein [Corynebacterium]MCQ4618946.1 hypothetical protein [Corynebacterium pseudogenitalium]EFK55456.1 hypothetical protein HMPREF0291_10714 [Corynebacterium genitalium ATCC 33030]MCQ4621468.1 hypothetical protein [Corynebacterium sp. CCUG 71335]MCQ4624936.1 hypothetical protein [Corynebacterium sp. CCUG 69979]MCQ4627864.1 hypothetical protein [Corynebacterium sp. CCUG 65737]
MIAIKNISQDLHARFGGAVDADVIDAVFAMALAEHMDRATVTKWIPVRAERAAIAELTKIADGTLDAAMYADAALAA